MPAAELEHEFLALHECSNPETCTWYCRSLDGMLACKNVNHGFLFSCVTYIYCQFFLNEPKHIKCIQVVEY